MTSAPRRRRITGPAAVVLAAVATLAAPVAAAPAEAAPPRLAGDWVMHLYIGARVFHDEVHVVAGPDGRLGGTLTVPDRFTAPLEATTDDGVTFRFGITADEGQGPFRVHYEGRWFPSDDTFVGFATLPDQEGALLGGFVGARR